MSVSVSVSVSVERESALDAPRHFADLASQAARSWHEVSPVVVYQARGGAESNSVPVILLHDTPVISHKDTIAQRKKDATSVYTLMI